MSQITAVIDRTVASIEEDMAPERSRPGSTPQYAPRRVPYRQTTIKHDNYGPSTTQTRAPDASHATPRTSSHGTEPMASQRFSGIQNTPYYNTPLTQINTAYSQMDYPELGSSTVPTPTTSAGGSYTPLTDESHHHQQQYLYATSVAASASQIVHNPSIRSPGPVTAPHGPLAGYTTQAPDGLPPQHYQDHPHSTGAWGHWATGPNGGNTWNEWTHAMVDPSTQDRYSANALLTLGAGPRGPGDHGGRDMGVDGHDVPQGQSGQWPGLLFHPPNVSGA